MPVLEFKLHLIRSAVLHHSAHTATNWYKGLIYSPDTAFMFVRVGRGSNIQL